MEWRTQNVTWDALNFVLLCRKHNDETLILFFVCVGLGVLSLRRNNSLCIRSFRWHCSRLHTVGTLHAMSWGRLQKAADGNVAWGERTAFVNAQGTGDSERQRRDRVTGSCRQVQPNGYGGPWSAAQSGVPNTLSVFLILLLCYIL
jgi:hypothetical protein